MSEPTRDELIASLREMREACCAAMRVVADLDVAERLGWAADTKQQRFIDELKIVGVADGFGKRADDLLRRVAPVVDAALPEPRSEDHSVRA